MLVEMCSTHPSGVVTGGSLRPLLLEFSAVLSMMPWILHKALIQTNVKGKKRNLSMRALALWTVAHLSR